LTPKKEMRESNPPETDELPGLVDEFALQPLFGTSPEMSPFRAKLRSPPLFTIYYPLFK
jgi:hypothetical protein